MITKQTPQSIKKLDECLKTYKQTFYNEEGAFVNEQ